MGLTLPVTCGICSQKFTAPAVADLVETDSGKARLGEILEKLVDHVRTEHKPAYQLAALQSSQLLRLICLMQYQTEDKAALQLRDFMRYQLWQSLAKNRPGTDDELASIAAQLGDGLKAQAKIPVQYLNPIKAAFSSVLKQCRDIWCEMGNHQPQPLIPASPTPNGKPTLVKP